jgi:dihydrodipicolinate synthase/N-acetylneuraminate lyase
LPAVQLILWFEKCTMLRRSTNLPILCHHFESRMVQSQKFLPWSGVFTAATTKMKSDFSIDALAIEKHLAWQIESGVHGIAVLGSLGENGTLTPNEKLEVINVAVSVAEGRLPVLSGVAETSTQGACKFVEEAAKHGVTGFMLLPAMQYVSDRRETLQHFRSVASATDLPIMLYNNPVSYQVDVTPAMFAELADEPKFVAIKESSADPRRINDIRNLVGDRYQIFTGVDDLALESLVLGAVGWVAGLVCAFPRESVALYGLIKQGRIAEALELYRWFLPLLHLDVSIKFIQNIKLAEALVGRGTEYVRPPRLPLGGQERTRVEAIIRTAINNRPALPNI